MSDIINVLRQGGEPFVSSKEVASRFKKRHDNVIQAIVNLKKKIPNDFHALNFKVQDIIEKNSMGWDYKNVEYFITRNGFALLAMGFTGNEAMKWKVKFIDAFDKMEKHLIPLLQKQIDDLQKKVNVAETKKLPEQRKHLIPVERLEENLFGEMVLTKIELVEMETLDKLTRLTSVQKHMLKIQEGLVKRVSDLSDNIRKENIQQKRSACKILQPTK